MKELETLNIVIQAQTQTFKKEIGKVNQSLNGMNKAVGGLQKKLLAGFSVAGLALLGKNVLKTADTLQALSDRTGIGVERLQELDYMAKQTGAKTENLGQAIKIMNERLAQGGDAFAKLGINTSNTETAFNEILVALSNITDESQRAFLGNQLLGEGYVSLLPIIRQGEDGMKALADEARVIGGVMSKETVGAIKRLSDSLVLFRTAIVGAFRPIVEVVVPVLQRMVNWLIVATGFVNGIIQALFGLSSASNAAAGNTVKSNNAIIKSNGKLAKSYAGFDELNTVQQNTGGTSTEVSGFEGIGEFDGDSLSASIELAKTRMEEFNKAVEAGKKFWEDYGVAITTATVAITLFWAAWNIGAWISSMGGLAAALAPLVGFLSGIGGYIASLFNFTKAFGDVYIAISQGGEATSLFSKYLLAITGNAGIKTMIITVSATIAAVVAVVVALYDAFVNNVKGIQDIWNTTWENIKNTFSNIWNQIKPIVDLAIALIMLIWEMGLKPLWDGFVEFVASLAILAMEIINFLLPVIDFFVKYLGPVIMVVLGLIGITFAGLAIAIGQIFGVVFKILGWFVDMLSWVFRNGWDLISGFISLLGGIVGLIVKIFVNLFLLIKQRFIDPFILIFKGIVDFFTGIFTGDMNKAVQGLADVFSGIVQLVVSPFKTAFNWVVDLWNNTIGKMSWKVPDWVPLIGGKSISAPKLTKFTSIPKLAQGGIVDEGQLFIAGEAGSEMIGSYKGKQTVMPLENTDFVAAMRDAVLEGVVSGLSTQGNGGDIVLTIDGMVLAKATEKNLNKLSTLKGGLDIAI